MLISKQAVRGYLARDFESFTWMKRASRDELEAELKHFKVRPVFRTRPWDHQLVCFIIAHYFPEFLFLLDMGLGKTKIVLDILLQALREGRAKRALITVPRLINMADWRTAAETHSDLEPFLVDCQDTEEKLDRLLNPRGDFTVIDYAGLHLAVSAKKKGKLVKSNALAEKVARRYDFYNMDECHKVGNHQSLWFSIMRHLTREAEFAFGTTGTLFSRDPEAIWSQFYLVDRGHTFGENLGLFRAAFFTSTVNRWGGVDLTYNRDMTRTLNRMMANRSIRYDDWEVHNLPEVLRQRRQLRLPSEQREHYLLALQGLINSAGVIHEQEAQWYRMRQITAGYMKWTDEFGDHEIRFKDNPKLEALTGLLEEAGSNKVVVVCEYRLTGLIVSEHLKRLKIDHEWLYGGTKDPIACKQRFIDDDGCRVMVLNSEAGGTGVDGLQAVSAFMVLYETPTSPTPRKQVIKRLHRPGQQRPVRVVDLVMTNTVDAGILDDLDAGLDLYASVMSGKPVDKKLFA